MFLKAISSACNVIAALPKVPVIPGQGELIIIGDLHGDLRALKKILKKEHVLKRLRTDLSLVFLGDYVDRGPASVETLYTVCNLLNAYPDKVILLRGNHEGPIHIPAAPYSFYNHIQQIYPNNAALQHVKTLFHNLPVAAIIPEYAFLVHGHIPADTTSIKEYNQLSETDPTLTELLWNDPAITPDTKPSFRGHGHYIGTDAVTRFLDANNLQWIIRGHEKPTNGYETSHRTLTLHTTGPKTTYLKIPLSNPTHPEHYIKQL